MNADSTFLPPPRRWVPPLLILAVVLLGAFVLLGWGLNRKAGLTQTVFEGAGPGRTVLVERLARTLDLTVLGKDGRLPRRFFTVRWRGVWNVPARALYTLSLGGDGRSAVRIDGRLAHEHPAPVPGANPRTILVEAGYRPIEVEYENTGDPPDFSLAVAPAGGTLRPLGPERLLPLKPQHPRVRVALETGRVLLGFLLWAVLGVSVWLGLVSLAARIRLLAARHARTATATTIRRGLTIALPVLIVAYAAVLRLDALTLMYGPVEKPAVVRALQQGSVAAAPYLRPGSFDWGPVQPSPHRDGQWSLYTSDPYTYLKYAREMRSFYAAHYREPLFPFVTKVFLGLLGNQDVAVSFASASFSVLALALTYLLGASAFSRGVGLGAALLIAIEYEAISWGVGGWRDDAFTCAVLLFAYALLRYRRIASERSAAVTGLAAGLACLVRITSLSFLLPGFVAVLFVGPRPWKSRLGRAGIGVLTMAIVVAPYLVNCWVAFGDPLYAINVHAGVYQATESRAAAPDLTAASYVGAKALGRPVQMLDTVILGLTSYPFLNKWRGLDRWLPHLGDWLSRAALFGLLLFAGSVPGRLLLLVLATSLIPYAATWNVAADWRFTEHAYPFYLIAACAGVRQACVWATPAGIRDLLARRTLSWKPLIPWLVTIGLAGLCAWVTLRLLPVLKVQEALRSGDAVAIGSGDRDGPFVGEGWLPPVTGGNVTARVSQGRSSVIRIPLPRVQDYGLTVRLDPFPRPLMVAAPRLRAVQVFLNGEPLGRLDLGWDPERFGSYDLPLPASAVRRGFNTLAFVPEQSAASLADGGSRPGAGEGGAFALWYVRITPGMRP